MWAFVRFIIAQITALATVGLATKAYYTEWGGDCLGFWFWVVGCLFVVAGIIWVDGFRERRFGIHCFVGVFLALTVVVRDMPPSDFVSMILWFVAVGYLVASLVHAIFSRYKINITSR